MQPALLLSVSILLCIVFFNAAQADEAVLPDCVRPKGKPKIDHVRDLKQVNGDFKDTVGNKQYGVFWTHAYYSSQIKLVHTPPKKHETPLIRRNFVIRMSKGGEQLGQWWLQTNTSCQLNGALPSQYPDKVEVYINRSDAI
jgi:hypothetical protein